MTERIIRLVRRWAGARTSTVGLPARTVDVDDLFERIRSACPSFVPVDDEAVPDRQDEPHPLDYVPIAGLAWHLVRLAADGRMDLVQPVLDLAEATLPSADGYARGLLVDGLLENLQNACLQTEGRVRLVDVRARLGPVSTSAWDELMRLWHGSPDEARTRLPPGSLPDDR